MASLAADSANVGTAALVPCGHDLCPSCGFAVVEVVVEEPALFYHGGFGGSRIDIKMLLPIPGRLYPSHYSLLYYTKGKPKTFVRPRVPIPVCRHCGGEIKDYGGHRKALNPEGINVSDVWTDIPPVRHRKTKHRGANALSEKMLERVLTISSKEGDLVLDPFGGSGTTYAVAERLHRRWIGVEMGDVEPIVARLTGGEKVEGIMPHKGACGKGQGFVTSTVLSKIAPKTPALQGRDG